MKTLKTITLGGILFMVMGFATIPFLWQAITSIKPMALLTSLPPLFPDKIVADHYHSLLENTAFLRSILNSLVVSILSTLLSLCLASPAAFALAKLPLRGRTFLLILILSVSIFPPIATVSPLFLMVNALGLRDTWWALVITYTAFTLPLTIWILTSFFQEIPEEIYKAARVDGCTPWSAFRKVLLPLAAPGLATAAILVFIFCWNEFLLALTFTSSETSRTIPVQIALFAGQHETPFGELAAASVTVTLPIIFLAFLFQRRIVAGLTSGAVKG